MPNHGSPGNMPTSFVCKLFAAITFCSILSLNAFAAPNAVIQQTIAAVDSGGLKALKTQLDQQCLSAVMAPKITNYPQVMTFSACREFARYFSAIDSPTVIQKATMSWLAAQPRLMPTLMSAVSEKDPPDHVLDVLSLLQSREQQRLDQYPDLTTA